MAKYDFTNETPFNEQPLYKQGYEDAIDKACEWLCEHIDDYARIGEDGAWVEHSVVRDFKKAMVE